MQPGGLNVFFLLSCPVRGNISDMMKTTELTNNIYHQDSPKSVFDLRPVPVPALQGDLMAR